MTKDRKYKLDEVVEWCTLVLGPVEVMSDHSKEHGGHESSTRRLHYSNGFCYLKLHQSRSHWHSEVHAYERWASAFGDYAPRIVAVRDEEPLALVVTELPGQIVDNADLLPSQELAVWRAAGAALPALHDLATGEYFGATMRDGRCAGETIQNAEEYVSKRFSEQIECAVRSAMINDEELAVIRAAYDLIPAFEEELPVPCHRDYCAANWLLSGEGTWAGVIDFEFSAWDVRVADFSRDPDWSWLHRPDLVEAFFEGYGRSLTAEEEQQLLVAHAEYALSAILWGNAYAFYGFEREGRESLAHLAALL